MKTNIRNNSGSSALHIAVERGEQDRLYILLHTNDVDINMTDTAGNTAAMICLKLNKTKLGSISRVKMFKSILERSRVDLDS